MKIKLEALKKENQESEVENSRLDERLKIKNV